jgi:hypothetical protein
MRKQSLKIMNDAMIRAEARVDAESNKKVDVVKRIPNLRNMSELKNFTVKWYSGVVKALQSVYKSEEEKDRDAKIVSRSDLSKAYELSSIREEDKQVTYGGKGFFGTPLPLIPDIRKTEVGLGLVGTLLEALGVSKKFERVVTLRKGPNKRINRYLIFQYRRLIKSINGNLVKSSSNRPAHVVWDYSIYKITNPLITQEEKAEFLNIKIRKWTPLHEYLVKEKININVEFNNLKRSLKRKARKYWAIGYLLIRNSISFRIAVLQKTLGKTGRWFHRDIDIVELFEIFEAYQDISDHFKSNMPMKRTWITQLMRNGKFKWRPLGIASYPWRIFSRAINNILETFLANSWPKNQHGYKTGRGVHTAWKQILNTIINAKNIIEFDFSGFFNTIRMEAIGSTLNRFMVPKPIIAYLINISSIDIKNISKTTRHNYLTTKDPTLQGWADAWVKNEYIHLYRKGYRSTGLPQGSALSPILSVVTLIVLEELEELGISHILYADDGLFYSNDEKDFLVSAKRVLDKHGVGARFHLGKSLSIKENNKWIAPLKFVGLIYDPFKDTLSAKTRNGATLKLKIGTIGYFADGTIKKKSIPDVQENDHWDWHNTNNKLFDLYENIYLNKSFSSIDNDSYLENIKTQTEKIMIERFSKYTVQKFSDLQFKEETDYIKMLFPASINLFQFLFPIRLLQSISKDSFFTMLEKYQTWMGDPFPWELLQNHYMTNRFWMDKDMTVKKYEETFQNRLNEKTSDDESGWWTHLNPNTNVHYNNEAAETILDNLKWFHQLNEVPKAIQPLLKDGELELGQWLELKINELNIEALPKIVVDHMNNHGGKLGYTQLTWRNIYNDPIFASFIARLFQDSFRTGVSKQNFQLTTNKKLLTLVKIIDRYIGRNAWQVSLQGERFDIFNASSFCSNLLIRLAQTWHPHVKSNKAAKVPIYLRTYKKIIERLIERRTSALRNDNEVFADYPLSPYKFSLTDKQLKTKLHLKRKYREIPSLSIETINRSAISTHEMKFIVILRDMHLIKSLNLDSPDLNHKMPTELEDIVYPYKAIRWDTLSPKNAKKRNKFPVKFVKIR